MWNKKFLLNFPFGFLIGWIVALIFMISLSDIVSEALQKHWIFLASATVTLIASTIALVGVFSGIENQNRLNQENRAKKLLAEKAFLPLALSRLTDICRIGLDYSSNLGAKISESSRGRVLMDVEQSLELSDETISSLKAVIEHSEDEMVCQQISVILKEYQVFRSRLLRRISDSSVTYNDGTIMEYIISWVYLQSLVGVIFDYARGDITGQVAPLSVEKFKKAMESSWSSTKVGKSIRFKGAGVYIDNYADSYAKAFANVGL